MDLTLASITGGLSWPLFALAFVVTLLGGIVKGAIGFALPLVMVATMANFASGDLILSAVIFTVMSTNIHQSLRDGFAPAFDAVRRYWKGMLAMVLGILASAPFVASINQQGFTAILAFVVLSFVALQLSGWQPAIRQERRGVVEVIVGIIGGLYGGVSGIWGPPFVLYLLAIKASKAETIRVLGAVFLIGGITLCLAHINTGVVNARTFPFALAMLPAAGIGMWIGFQLQDRLDPKRFRFWVLIVLGVVGLNLAWRAVMG